MDIPPTSRRKRLLLGNDAERTTGLAATNGVGPDQFRLAVGPEQIDLGLAVTEYVDVGRPVIVAEDDHAEALGTQHGDHVNR